MSRKMPIVMRFVGGPHHNLDWNKYDTDLSDMPPMLCLQQGRSRSIYTFAHVLLTVVPLVTYQYLGEADE